jgi:hypothetical protein
MNSLTLGPVHALESSLQTKHHKRMETIGISPRLTQNSVKENKIGKPISNIEKTNLTALSTEMEVDHDGRNCGSKRGGLIGSITSNKKQKTSGNMVSLPNNSRQFKSSLFCFLIP